MLAMGAMLFSLTGCGWFSSPAPLARGLSLSQVKHQLLARIANWHAVSAELEDTVSLVGRPTQKLGVSLIAETNPTQYAVKVTGGTAPIQIISTPRETLWFEQGRSHYAVMAAAPTSPAYLRLLGTELPTMVNGSHMTKVHLEPGNIARLTMQSVLPTGLKATVNLTFNFTTNTPVRLVAEWSGGTITETVSHFVVNPTVSRSAFSFVPPSGVTPTVAQNPGASALALPMATLPFSVILPPSGAADSLTGVDVGPTSSGSPVLILSYTTPTGNPLLLTERKTSRKPPALPSGTTSTTETVGTTAVTIGTLPSGQELAMLSLGKTLILIEGRSQDVGAVVNLWNAEGLMMTRSAKTSSSAG